MVTSRLALMLNGVSIDGLIACHKCDNPPCINPDHLYAGTFSDNTRDAVSRKRFIRKYDLREVNTKRYEAAQKKDVQRNQVMLMNALMNALGEILRRQKFIVLK
jgi:hypothetical protein